MVLSTSGSAEQRKTSLEETSFRSKEFMLAKNLGSFQGPEHMAIVLPKANDTPVCHCSIVHVTGQPWHGDTSHGFAQVPSLPVREVCRFEFGDYHRHQ